MSAENLRYRVFVHNRELRRPLQLDALYTAAHEVARNAIITKMPKKRARRLISGNSASCPAICIVGGQSSVSQYVTRFDRHAAKTR